VTVTVTCVVWDTFPLVAVIVTVYVPGVARSDAETVSVDELVLWDCRFTTDGARDVVGFERERLAVRLAGATWADRVTLPENPLRLVNVNVDVPEDPSGIESDVGFAAMPKSPMFTETLAKRVTFPLVPFTRTV
jgi:hypothetical protein